MMKGIKKIRLEKYDYKQNGHYFITICTDYRNNILIGKTRDVVARFIEQLPAEINGLVLDYYVLMPNHLHMILLLKDCDLRLGEIIRRFKAKASRNRGYRIWQPNYYEHVIRSEKALKKIREYVVNNPEKEKLDFKGLYKNNDNNGAQ